MLIGFADNRAAARPNAPRSVGAAGAGDRWAVHWCYPDYWRLSNDRRSIWSNATSSIYTFGAHHGVGIMDSMELSKRNDEGKKESSHARLLPVAPPSLRSPREMH